MSQLYGPAYLLFGQIVPMGIGFQYTRVRLRNDSPFDVVVSFLPNKPTIPPFVVNSGTPLVINGDWTDVVPARGVATLPVSAGGQTWTGRLWLLALDPANQVTNLGTNVGRMWVTAYESGEDIPTDAVSTSIHDLQRQSRVQSVPVTAASPSNFSFDSGDLAIGGTLDPGPAVICVGPFPGFAAADGGWDGVKALYIYLYSLDAYPYADGVGYWELLADHRSVANPNVTLRTDHLYYFATGRIAANGVMNAARFQSPFPFTTRLVPPVHTGITQLQLKLSNSSVATNRIIINVAIDTDNMNQTQPLGIGYGQLSSDGGTFSNLPQSTF